jgi:transposase
MGPPITPETNGEHRPSYHPKPMEYNIPMYDPLPYS